jgi:hypothetical protein
MRGMTSTSLSLGCFVCLLGGCAAGELQQTEFCAEFAAMRCDAEENCCDDPTLRSIDRSACMRATLAECRASIEGSAFVDGRARYDPAMARVFLDIRAEEAATCAAVTEPVEFVIPLGGVGTDCSVTDTDQSGRYACRAELACFHPPGVCGEPIEGLAIGEPCASPSECGRGLSCFDGACDSKRAAGASCSTGYECLDGGCNDGRCGVPPFDADAWYCVGAV